MHKEGAMKAIALSLDHPEVKTKIMVLELLTTVCMVPPHGHKYCLHTIDTFLGVIKLTSTCSQADCRGYDQLQECKA